MSRAVSADISTLTDDVALVREWTILESFSAASCFTSAGWVQTWLAQLPKDVPLYIARATCDQALVGLAIFGRAKVRSRLSVRDALCLLETGRADLDRLCIEMNGMLAHRQYDRDVYDAILAAISRAMPDAIIVMSSLAESAVIEEVARRQGWLVEHQSHDAPYIDFNALRGQHTSYRDALKKKARYAVRSACRRYAEAFGLPKVVPAGNVNEAMRMLEELARMSRKRWVATAVRSAFDVPFFAQFHLALVRSRHESGLPCLFEVRYGATLVGIVYVLEYRGWTAFYQCGYDYSLLGEHAQPGYAVLPPVIEHLESRGAQAFDFLGDATHYKRALSTNKRALVTLRLAPPTLRNRAENLVHRLAKRVRAALRRPSRRQSEQR